MEKTIISKNENQSKNLFKFLIPSLFGLLLFVIPLFHMVNYLNLTAYLLLI